MAHACLELGFLGRERGTRTPDLLLPKQVRYQLRYFPDWRFQASGSADRSALADTDQIGWIGVAWIRGHVDSVVTESG